jgi:hypothetical protein
MSEKMEPCALCGAGPTKRFSFWGCSNPSCDVDGPYNDESGEGWNRLMRREPVKAEPKAGTVRKIVQIASAGEDGCWALADDGTLWEGGWSAQRFKWHQTADLPQAAEEVGKVETDE